MNAYCIKGKEHVLSNLHRSVAPLKNSLKPVLIAFGNHDDNAFQFLNPNIPAAEREWIISDKDWKEKVTDLFPGQTERFTMTAMNIRNIIIMILRKKEQE